jgi:Spy/CpxP family protein refolding chaperone
MKRWKVILGIALIFIAGALAGSLGSMHYVKTRLPFHRHSLEKRAHSIMKRLDGRLNLTEEQWKKMESIVLQTQKEAQELFKEQREAMHTLMERDMEEFKTILDQEQRQKLEELRQEFEKRRMEREKDRD